MSGPVVWTNADVEWVSARLDVVNGKRGARRLSLDEVRGAVERCAAGAPFVLIDGGDVDDARKQTSLCLCVKTETTVVVGLAVARTGPVTPARAFRDLAEWDRWTPSANLVRCERWASRASSDRRPIALERAPGGLLDAVLDDPEAMAPRLVYADALMDQGDPRGDFIAAQCAFTQTGDAAHAQRADELLAAHGRTWFGPLATAPGVGFRNGFLDALTVIDPDVIDQAVLAREPVWLVVVAPRRRLELGRFLSWPLWRTVRSLSLEPTETARLVLDQLPGLFETRVLRRLESLSLAGQVLRDEGLAALAGSDAFPRLRALSLSDDAFSATGTRALTKAAWFGQLERLALVHDELDDDAVAALAKGRARALTSLSLASNVISDEGALALSRAPSLRTLEVLRLTSNRIGRPGALALRAAFPDADVWLESNPIGAALTRAGRRGS